MTGFAWNVFIGGWVFRATRRDLRVSKLLARLAQASGEEARRALAALDYEVEGIRGDRGGDKVSYEERVQSVLTIAAHVAHAGHPERALEWTMQLEAGVVGPGAAAMHAASEAGFRIALGDRAGARRAIAPVPRPAIAPWEDLLLAREALLDALEGDGRAAAERAARALDDKPTSPARPIWMVVRAHGLARAGAMEDAREILLSMRTEEGESYLRRVASQAGPASLLAESLLNEHGAYR